MLNFDIADGHRPPLQFTRPERVHDLYSQNPRPARHARHFYTFLHYANTCFGVTSARKRIQIQIHESGEAFCCSQSHSRRNLGGQGATGGHTALAPDRFVETPDIGTGRGFMDISDSRDPHVWHAISNRRGFPGSPLARQTGLSQPGTVPLRLAGMGWAKRSGARLGISGQHWYRGR